MFLFRKLESIVLQVKHNHQATSASTMWALPIFLQGLLIASISAASNENNPIVSVKEGKLKGAIKELLDESSYYSFKGIPYAQPPIGKLRFKAPLPPKPWSGIYEAIEHRSICAQVSLSTLQFEGSEDCLFLNVYTKCLEASSKLPVIVFIHGGSFRAGSGNDNLFGPEFLLQHDLIVVTINYRLEALGFLCLDTPEVPGNAGMKDQVAALRWVQNNIAQFGGDPENVSLCGESAGSASATYHMISPMSKGLFHKVIAESAVMLEDWAIGFNARNRAFRVGKYLGKETNDVNELLDHLQSVPANQLANVTFKTRTQDEKYRVGIQSFFVPVAEKKFKNVESFIDEDPMNMVLEKKFNRVPLIVGYNSDEGLLILKDELKKADFYNNHPEFLVPRSIAQRLSKDTLKEFGNRIKTFYFGNGEMSNDTSTAIVNMQSDINFIYNTHRFAHFYTVMNAPIFMYKFSLDTELNLVKILQGLAHFKGACHGDELCYLFYNVLNKDVYKENDYLKELVYKVTKLWADFAKTGTFTPDNSYGIRWKSYTRRFKEYLNINDPPTTGYYSECDRVEFWNTLYCEAGLPCITNGCGCSN